LLNVTAAVTLNTDVVIAGRILEDGLPFEAGHVQLMCSPGGEVLETTTDGHGHCVFAGASCHSQATAVCAMSIGRGLPQAHMFTLNCSKGPLMGCVTKLETIFDLTCTLPGHSVIEKILNFAHTFEQQDDAHTESHCRQQATPGSAELRWRLHCRQQATPGGVDDRWAVVPRFETAGELDGANELEGAACDN
jgi:hypothetical protein